MENLDNTMEKPVKEEMSDLAINEQGNLETNMEKRIQDAISNAQKGLERMNTEGGLDAVVAAAENLPEDSKQIILNKWNAGIADAENKQFKSTDANERGDFGNCIQEIRRIGLVIGRFAELSAHKIGSVIKS